MRLEALRRAALALVIAVAAGGPAPALAGDIHGRLRMPGRGPDGAAGDAVV